MHLEWVDMESKNGITASVCLKKINKPPLQKIKTWRGFIIGSYSSRSLFLTVEISDTMELRSKESIDNREAAIKRTGVPSWFISIEWYPCTKHNLQIYARPFYISTSWSNADSYYSWLIVASIITTMNQRLHFHSKWHYICSRCSLFHSESFLCAHHSLLHLSILLTTRFHL